MAETSAIHLPQDERGIAEEPLEESNCCGIPDHVYTPSQESYMQSLENLFQDQPLLLESFELEIYRQEHATCCGRLTTRPISDLQVHAEKLFQRHAEAKDGVAQFLHTLLPQRYADEAAANKIKQAEYHAACAMQSHSPLLKLPRELRDKIWREVLHEDVIHVTRGLVEGDSLERYIYYTCVCDDKLNSLACGLGEGEHLACAMQDSTTYLDIRLVCKQILTELPDVDRAIFGQCAFHFSTLDVAEGWLFGLEEHQRAAITRLRFALGHRMANATEGTSWANICNYFSIPWDRKTLRDDIFELDLEDDFLKSSHHFYYSDCYYGHNSDRLYKRWQVSFSTGANSSASWDVSTNLRAKRNGEPKIDIAAQSSIEQDWSSPLASPDPSLVDSHDEAANSEYIEPLQNACWFLQDMWQFRQYNGLTLRLWYDERDPKEVVLPDKFADALRAKMREPLIGPWKIPYFED